MFEDFRGRASTIQLTNILTPIHVYMGCIMSWKALLGQKGKFKAVRLELMTCLPRTSL